MTTIAVIDLSNIFWAAWMSQRDGDPVSAAHDHTVAKVNRIAAQFGVTGAEGRSAVGIAVDAKDNWRRAVSPTYKAGRAERGPAAWAQLGHTIDTLRAEGYPIWHEEGFEADDVMATVAAQAPKAGHDVVLITNDKDLRQCIRDAVPGGSPGVSVLTPGDSRAQPMRITEANCGMDKTLIPPRLMRDYLALRGDGSDNLPGCKGIGPVKAMKLLETFGTFPGVVAAFEAEDERMTEADGKLLAAIVGENADGPIRGIDEAQRTWDLVALRTDVPVDWSEALRERVQAPREAATRTRADVARETAAHPQAPTEAEYEDASSGTVNAPRDGAPDGAGRLPALEPGSTTLALAPVEWRLQCEPRDFDTMWDLAKLMNNSRCFPSLKNPEQVHAAMMLGRAHSIPAVIAAMNCYPVKDRMSMSAALIVGLCLRDPRCEYLEWDSEDDKSCTWAAKRVGRPEKRLTFTLDMAIRAGYTDTYKGGTMGKDGMYYKDAATMLSARCSTRLARRVFPDIVAGLYSTEEIGTGEGAEQ